MTPRFRIVYVSVLALLALTAVEQHLRADPDQHADVVTLASDAPRTLKVFTDKTAKLLIPVFGIEKSALVDTWGQSRGAGTRHHTAIDILAPRGTPAVAVVNGTIAKLHESVAGGHTLYLTDETHTLVYYYAHLDAYAAGIQQGTEVRQGDVVGYVGSTGNAPERTPHLHFGIEQMPASGEWWKGVPMNPYPILIEEGTTVK